MKKKLSRQQLEVMKILWDSEVPLKASDIVNKHASLNINTVQACLRVLIKAEAIEVADIIYSRTVLSRCYRPLISKDQYFNDTYKDIIGEATRSSLIASLIKSETNVAELNILKDLIDKRKKELEEK